MKKSLIAICLLSMFSLTGCKQINETTKVSVGMVTDSGIIDDKSFNQGTWQGIEKASKELGVNAKYLNPTGTTEADYLKEIGNLYEANYKFIVTPGFKFETTINKAQEKYKDAKFVLIDGVPHDGSYKENIGDNTISIFFTEHEAGFLAGVATALQLKTGDAGFIGGMEIPAVQKFNWGFQQGIEYSNTTYKTEVTIKEENVVYEGSFDNTVAGQQIGAQMYDRGVKAIMVAGGATTNGVITEAKNRAVKGEEVWTIGVDVDQYAEGIYEGNKSVMLTSAMKNIDSAAYDMIKLETQGAFRGGNKIVLDAKNGGVGIPEENPNLSLETQKYALETLELIKNGTIKVQDNGNGLIK